MLSPSMARSKSCKHSHQQITVCRLKRSKKEEPEQGRVSCGSQISKLQASDEWIFTAED